MTEADRERAAGDRSAGFISRLAWDRRFAAGVLVLAGLMMFGIVLFVGRWLLFWQDEWDFVFERQTRPLAKVPRGVRRTLTHTVVRMDVSDPESYVLSRSSGRTAVIAGPWRAALTSTTAN